jgi:hypothetical protein
MQLIEKITEDFVNGMVKSGNFATRSIVGLIKELDSIDGNLIGSDRNSQLIDGVGIGIQQVTLSSAYQNRVKRVLNSLPKIRKETERSFIVKNGILDRNTVAILNQLEIDNRILISQVLGEQTIINEVLSPVLGILNQMTATMMPKEQAINLARNKVPSLFTQFAHVRVMTILQTYVREMNNVMSNSKELTWFKYSGPTGTTALGNPIRDFCNHRVGDTFLNEEIKLWPNETWEGKIPNTNQNNIFVVLGGYNCRHTLEAVKFKDVPQKDINRARNLGFI